MRPIKTVFIFMTTVFFVYIAYGQPLRGVQKEEAIGLARKWAESSHPPMNSSHMQAYAIYLPQENSWIIEFRDQSPESSPDSDYMLRVQATSGKSPQLIQGVQKQRYRSYFEKK